MNSTIFDRISIGFDIETDIRDTTSENCDYCENTGKVEVFNPKSQGEAIIPCPKCRPKHTQARRRK